LLVQQPNELLLLLTVRESALQIKTKIKCIK
jgi:hypothetical protein